MNINNSKQIPFMRWRDFKNFEKFTFIHGTFGFDVADETYENASKDPTFKLIIEKMLINSKSGDVTPLILYDIDISNVYIGYIDETEHAEVASISSGTISFADIQYNSQNDTMNIQHGSDELLSADNVKKIFNQSIIGKGDIKLYRHSIYYYQDNVTLDFEVISSSSLNVDSLTDLKTLCKNNALVMASGKYTLNDVNHIITAVKVTADAVFGFYDGSTSNRIPLTTNQFTDTITIV